MANKARSIDPGEAVGIIAAQSIGEPGTQMSLAYEEKVLIREKEQIKAHKIGEFIDACFERFGFACEGGHEICGLPNDAEIYSPSLLASEKVEWRKVSALSRHSAPEKLLQITLRSGRKIIATPFHSFVVRKGNSIVPVAGSSLGKNDRLPVLRRLALSAEASAANPKNSVNAQEVLATRLKFMVAQNGQLYAYPREGSRPMPAQIELTDEFGWLAGIYLSEGNSTRNYVSISNTDGAILAKVRQFADSHGFSHNEYDNMRGFSLGHDIRINSTLLSQFLIATCGTSSYEKRVPEFAYSADERFIASLLRGYFDGDGNISVQRKAIRASSKSRELIDGLCILLSRLGIFASKRPDKRTHNLSISYRYARQFLEGIGSDMQEKREALCSLAKHHAKTGYNQIDVIPGIGTALTRAARQLGVPSRYLNNFTKRGYIGRSTLRKYLSLFESLAAQKKTDLPELAVLRRAAESDVVWDEIETLEYIEPASRYVYDFTVPGSETFATFDGVITHNTMRTFHYAGVAEQVPTGLPRLIELVDARKEPKKPLMNVFLKEEFAKSEPKVRAIAHEMESTLLSSLASIEEDFSQKIISIAIDEKTISEEQIELEEIKKKIQKLASVSEGDSKNIFIIKPTKASSLRNIRRLTNKLRGLHIKGIEKISRTMLLTAPDGMHYIRTGGSNLAAVMKHPAVIPEKTYTNDVQEIERVLGVEAARQAVTNELKQVLDMQNLNVDIRHCMLLADAMTMDGKIKSIGRHGLSGEKAGVLARAAFEETIKHLINAAVHAEEDRLIGVTENIIIGQTVPVGTGLVKLKMKM